MEAKVDVEQWLMEHGSKRGKSNMVQFIMEQGDHPRSAAPPKQPGSAQPTSQAPRDLPRSQHDQELLIRLTKEVDTLRKSITAVEEERTALAERATLSTKEMLEERSQRILIDAKMKELEAHVKALKGKAERYDEEQAARESTDNRFRELQKEHQQLIRSHKELEEKVGELRVEKEVVLEAKTVLQERHDELEAELEATRSQLLESDTQLEETQLKCHKLQETLKLYI